MCVGDCIVEVESSPKFQFHEVMVSEVISANETVVEQGILIVSKAAKICGFTVTVATSVALHPSLNAVIETVYVPAVE